MRSMHIYIYLYAVYAYHVALYTLWVHFDVMCSHHSKDTAWNFLIFLGMISG